MYNTSLLTTGTMLYTKSPELIHLVGLKIYVCWLATPHFPLPLTPNTNGLLFNSMNLPVLDTPYKWNYAEFSFCNWLISPSIMSSRFLHVIAYCRISFFFFKAEEYSIVWIYYIFFIYLSVDGHLSFFHMLAIWQATKAKINKWNDLNLKCLCTIK